MNRFFKHYQFFKIKRGPILDVGSGSNPFWRANVLMERFLDNDVQRPGKLISDRTMVCGDVHKMPFIDKSFVFVHCSHLLEHLDRPEEAILEMMRVADSGYIETPSEIHEYLDLNIPFHRWAISNEDNEIVFREKPKHLSDHPLVSALVNRKNFTWQYIKNHNRNILCLSWFWHDEIKYRIERCDDPIGFYEMSADNQERKEAYVANVTKIKIKKVLSKMLSPKINIYDLIACPLCKIRVTLNDSYLKCANCKRKYPVINKIPMMTEDHGF